MASVFYFFAYKVRLLLYKLNILKKETLKAIVISIGNITSGGTGKTPITIEVAKYLLKEGYKVAVLSRGYKRKALYKSSSSNILVSDGQEILTDYEESGDEPYLIAKKVPKAIVLVGKNRIKSGHSAIKLGAEVLILDDGYQYLRLNRDENILLFDSYKPLDNGHLLPSGLLRELPDSINRATAITFSNSENLPTNENDIKKIKQYTLNKPTISMQYKIKQLVGINIKRKINIQDTQNLKVIAFCGIANSQSFLDTLKKYELDVVNYLTFPDHHYYSYDDIKKIVQSTEKYKIENIVTTEKDAIKIETLCEAAPATFWATELEVLWNVDNPFEVMFVNKDRWDKKKQP